MKVDGLASGLSERGKQKVWERRMERKGGLRAIREKRQEGEGH